MTRRRPQTRTQTRPRTRTISISLENRGQTTQDFAVGIGVFLLAVAFVFSYVPSLITPYTASTASETAQADRIAGEILEAVSTDERNEINVSDFEDLDGNLSDFGLRDIDRINVTIEPLDREKDGSYTIGDDYRDRPSGTATRLVTIDYSSPDPDDPECKPACRLVVRVW